MVDKALPDTATVQPAPSAGVAHVAEGIGVSRSRLDKACVARFGRSLGKEILAARLGKAKALLREGRLNIDEIAHATGFGASAYFIKKFKTAFGDTPRRWRTIHPAVA